MLRPRLGGCTLSHTLAQIALPKSFSDPITVLSHTTTNRILKNFLDTRMLKSPRVGCNCFSLRHTASYIIVMSHWLERRRAHKQELDYNAIACWSHVSPHPLRQCSESVRAHKHVFYPCLNTTTWIPYHAERTDAHKTKLCKIYAFVFVVATQYSVSIACRYD